MKRSAFDIEIYPNYCLFAFGSGAEEGTTCFELFGEDSVLSKADISRIRDLLKGHELYGFNSKNFDLPILGYALRGAEVSKLKEMANAIIKENLKYFQTETRYGIRSPDCYHVDIQPYLQGYVSLKLFGARIHVEHLQDLPYPPDQPLNREQAEHVRVYCLKDLTATVRIAKQLSDRIDLRRGLSEKYNIDMMSIGDAGIAERVLKAELLKRDPDHDFTEKQPRKKWLFKAPDYLNFETETLKNFLAEIQKIVFSVHDYKLDTPLELSRIITLGETRYQFGIGGLHSLDDRINLVTDDLYEVIDADVSSYYPALMINLRINPVMFGNGFNMIFKRIRDQRVKAKRNKDKSTADSLKIVLNSTYGKMNNRYSKLYDTEKLVAVTLSGQFSLMMLIERLFLAGFDVISANTDGIVTKVARTRKREYENILFDWEVDTCLSLEMTSYKEIHARDVNNYFALTVDGYVKRKGVFAQGSLQKNPSADIVADAVIEHILNNIPFRETLRKETDIRKFLKVRTVQGGALFRGEFIGKVVRWYYVKNGDEVISTVKQTVKGNHSTVPDTKGCQPLQDLQTVRAEDYDIDYARYEEECEKLLGTLVKEEPVTWL